jgi:hypothetical protein
MSPAKKRGPGRPKLGKAARTHVLSIKISADERKAWDALAEKQGITIGALIRESVEMAIARGSSR